MANANPSPETRFKPGESGNPQGRPRGVSLTNAILRNLTEEDADRLVKALIERAGGDDRAFAQLIERTDGKVTDKIEHSGDLTLSLQALNEIKQRAGN